MPEERNVAVHEAAHAVVAWYVGMRPTLVTLATEGVKHGETHHDPPMPEGGQQDLAQALLWSSLQVIQHAAGACAELALGTNHEDCGWSGDFRRFEPIVSAISRICGYSYDHCWALLSAMTKEILQQADIWSLVEELSERLVRARTLSSDDLDDFFRNRTADGAEARILTLRQFLNTPHAHAASKAYPDV